MLSDNSCFNCDLIFLRNDIFLLIQEEVRIFLLRKKAQLDELYAWTKANGVLEIIRFALFYSISQVI